eukprot:4128260-Prorocentrum_lima.AAC.1
MPRVHVATSALACSVPLRVRSLDGSSLGELRADDDSGWALSEVTGLREQCRASAAVRQEEPRIGLRP